MTPILTTEHIDSLMPPLGMAPFSVLSGPAEIRRFARAVEAATQQALTLAASDSEEQRSTLMNKDPAPHPVGE